MSVAGVITYQINSDGSLDGRWTHPESQGKIGTERALGGTPGRLPGGYNVQIYDNDGTEFFVGSLDIQAVGEAFTLTWRGAPPAAAGGNLSTYSGVGLLENGQRLVACFQESLPPTPSG